MMHLTRLFLLALAVLLPACTVLDPDQELSCGLRRRTEVPVAVVGNVPLITVGINGRQTVLILDTGAQSMLLTQGAVKRLELRTDARSPITVRGTGGETRSWPAVLQGFRLGDVALPDQLAAVLPFELPNVGPLKPEGLLGVDVLGRFEVDLNLPARRMALYSGRACPDEVLPLQGPFTEAEAPSARRNRLSIAAELDGQPMVALLDSGSQNTIVSMAAAVRVGVDPMVVAQGPVRLLSGAGPRPVEAHLHRFRQLQIAGETGREPLLTVKPQEVVDEDDMIIGMDYMSSRRIWLAYPRRKVFIQRPLRSATPVAMLRTGG